MEAVLCSDHEGKDVLSVPDFINHTTGVALTKWKKKSPPPLLNATFHDALLGSLNAYTAQQFTLHLDNTTTWRPCYIVHSIVNKN